DAWDPMQDPDLLAFVLNLKRGAVRRRDDAVPNVGDGNGRAGLIAISDFGAPEQHVHQQEERCDDEEEEPGPHVTDQDAGILMDWPALSRLGSRLGFAAKMLSNRTR